MANKTTRLFITYYDLFEYLNNILKSDTVEKMMRVQLVAEGMEEAIEKLRPTIGHAKADSVRKAVDAAVSSSVEVDVVQWVGNLTLNNKAKDQFLKDLQSQIPDNSFQIDQIVAEKLTKKKVFKGAYGFKLSIDSDHLSKVVKSRTSHVGYEEIILNIPDFKEVEK